MAYFYLNVRTGEALIRDPDAYEFSTAQAARDAAERTARELIVADPNYVLMDKQIEIEDGETGHPVAIVCVHDIAPELCDTYVWE